MFWPDAPTSTKRCTKRSLVDRAGLRADRTDRSGGRPGVSAIFKSQDLTYPREKRMLTSIGVPRLVEHPTELVSLLLELDLCCDRRRY